jgi:insertion element IS1 protein InsB
MSDGMVVLSRKIKVYIWLAIDRTTREIIGCYLTDRSRKSAKKLGSSLPVVDRQCAVNYTYFWEVYKTVIPRKSHRSVGKKNDQTNHVERLNNTLRQRISRLVRQRLSFSKKMDNHIRAIWYLIHNYNAQLARH